MIYTMGLIDRLFRRRRVERHDIVCGTCTRVVGWYKSPPGGAYVTRGYCGAHPRDPANWRFAPAVHVRFGPSDEATESINLMCMVCGVALIRLFAAKSCSFTLWWACNDCMKGGHLDPRTGEVVAADGRILFKPVEPPKKGETNGD